MQEEAFNRYSLLLDCTARRVKQYAQLQFNQGNYGVTVDQWIVLKNLNESDNITQKELAKLCGKDQPTLTRILDLLVKKEFVSRVMHEQDRRSFIVRLTDKGRTKVKEMTPYVKDIRMKAWENLEESDFKHLQRILNTIYKNLELNDND
ncbi:MarR family winged helix-turn-helix transcriptional regulator [Albibacterium profundi]|uniref:MarR family transcriptional regulator n=1 Tax=Albibacterium profundi TaxID=3134906 RepID=A0ABV5C9Z4_9SPHI